VILSSGSNATGGGEKVSALHRYPLITWIIIRISVMLAMAAAWTAPQARATQLTTTTLALSSSSIASGTPITLTASVLAGATPVTTGQVIFYDATATYCENAALLGLSQLTSAGSATLKFVPGIGSHNYLAAFRANAGYAASSSPSEALTVTGTYPTTTAVVSSGSAGSYTLTATVVATGSTLSPTEGVSFLDTSNVNYSVGSAILGTSTFAETLGAQVTYAAGTNPSAIAVGDFNGDGVPDMAVLISASNNFSILLGNGNGTFQTQVTYAVGGSPRGIQTADFNGDGIPDLVAADNSGAASVLLGNGNGTFGAKTDYATGSGTSGVVVADFNGDGKPDLATSNQNGNNVSVLVGTFQPQVTYTVGSHPKSIAEGDSNGDGIPDLAVANGTFKTQVTYAVGTTPDAVAVADFNGDGNADVVVGNNGSATASVFLNLLTQTSAATASEIAVPGSGTHLVDGSYSGDTNFSSSVSSAVSLTATPIATTLALTANAASNGTARPVALTQPPAPR
jgi:hypothetical protein